MAKIQPSKASSLFDDSDNSDLFDPNPPVKQKETTKPVTLPTKPVVEPTRPAVEPTKPAIVRF